MFEGAFVPWYQSISIGTSATSAMGLELLDKDVVSLVTDSNLTPCGPIEQESNDQAGGQEKSAETSKTTNSFEDHAQNFPNHNHSSCTSVSLPFHHQRSQGQRLK